MLFHRAGIQHFLLIVGWGEGGGVSPAAPSHIPSLDKAGLTQLIQYVHSLWFRSDRARTGMRRTGTYRHGIVETNPSENILYSVQYMLPPHSAIITLN